MHQMPQQWKALFIEFKTIALTCPIWQYMAMERQDTTYTAESVLNALGYPDAMSAARQQARMILLGRKAHYQAAIQEIRARWSCSLNELQIKYEVEGAENFDADDDYLQWQWYTNAIETVEAQLAAIAQ